MSDPSTERPRKDTGNDTVEDAATMDETTVTGNKAETDQVTAEADAKAEPEPVAHEHHEEEHQGSSLAGTALKYLVIALVIFGFALWAIPRVIPHLPEKWAAELMPAQMATDQRLSTIEAQLSEDASAEAVAALEAQIADLQTRLAAAEEEAATARAAAEEAASAAASIGVSEAVVTEAGDSAARAATAAETATTAATESGRVASAAMRDAASLARRMTGFEAQLAAVSEEITALGQSMAATRPADGETGTSQEAAAAYTALKSRLDHLVAQINGTDFLTGEDAATLVTQDDLRTARTALASNLEAVLARLPEPEQVASKTDLGEVQGALEGSIKELSARVGAVEDSAAASREAASAAQGQVAAAIKLASLEGAVANMRSRLEHGQSFAAALGKVSELSGMVAPAELSSVAATGTATPAVLLADFGGAYQRAIAADIREQSDGGLFGNATARLRSVAAGRPKGAQEGETVEAILSRVEAALRAEDAAGALAETDALSDGVKEALGGWLTALSQRAAAMSAAEDFIAGLGTNEG